MAQVNRRLDLAVSRALRNGVPHIHDDCARLSVPVKDQKRTKQGRVRKRSSGGPLKEKKKFEWANDESVM